MSLPSKLPSTYESLAIITGSSKGIGAGLTARLPSPRWACVGISRSELESKADYWHLCADLSSLEGIKDCLHALTPLLDTPHLKQAVLWNNAGSLAPAGFVGGLDATGMIQQQVLNTIAPLSLANAFIRGTARLGKQAVVVNLSSGAALKPYRGWAGYCASKAALAMWTQSAGLEQLHAHGAEAARVLSIAPGVVDTPMQNWIRDRDPATFPDLPRFEQLHHKGQLTDPDAVAKRLWEVALDPQHVTGSTLDIRQL